MAYIRLNTDIPVPEVLAWSDDDKNSTGTEYIIMQAASGVRLDQKWDHMNPHQHMMCVKGVSNLIRQMIQLQFSAYGSIYFDDAPIDQASKLYLTDGFCIGPHCGTQYWPCNPDETRSYHLTKPNQGPWKDLRSFASGLIDAGLSQIPEEAPDYPKEAAREHIDLLQTGMNVLERLIETDIIRKVSGPALLHPDLHKRNLFVSGDDPARITAVIDWGSSAIEPVFSFANETPDLIHPLRELQPSQKSEISANSVLDEEICRETFRVAVWTWAPKLHDARAVDEKILRPFRYCHTTVRDGPAAFRQELIWLSESWEELGLPGICPYRPSSQELDAHSKQFSDFQISQEIKHRLVEMIGSNTDGWVPSDAWDDARKLNKEVFDLWLEENEQGMNEERAKMAWPFDID